MVMKREQRTKFIYLSLLFLLLFMSNSSIKADDIFKCISADGSVTFQAVPCRNATQKKMEIKNISDPNYDPNAELRRLEAYNHNQAVLDKMDSLNKTNVSSQPSTHSDKGENSACRYARSNLTSLERTWDGIRLKGYKSSTGNYYRKKIHDAESHVRETCR